MGYLTGKRQARAAAARARAAGWRIDPADPRRSIREGFPRSGTGTVTITFTGNGASASGGPGGHMGPPMSWVPCPHCGELAPPAGGNGGPQAVWCPHCKKQIS